LSHSHEPDDHARGAERVRNQRRTSVLGYLVILFAAAFLLLLMAYFQQQRANSETTDALKQSVSTVESIQALLEDNQKLQEENGALKEAAAQLNSRLQELTDQVDSLTGALSRLEQDGKLTQQALDYFWQLDEAFVRGRYSLCRELIGKMEESGKGTAPLKDFLPTESTTANDRYSPAGRYQEIRSALL